jgi:hypothetical protein
MIGSKKLAISIQSEENTMKRPNLTYELVGDKMMVKVSRTGLTKVVE